MDGKLTFVDPAEIEARTGDRNVLLAREVIELAQHCRSGHVQGAAERRAIRLVRMTRQDPDDPILVTRHDRFQGRRLTHDERRVVVRRSHQPTGMVEHNQISARGRISELGLQPG